MSEVLQATELNQDNVSQISSYLMAADSGFTLDNMTYTGAYGASSLIDYFNPLATDGTAMGSGILLTSGDGTPNETNTQGWYSTSNGVAGDADLTATAQAAFAGAGQTYDASMIEFTINITDPSLQGISFDLMFGSDEFPEWASTSFVDVAAVYVNGTNYGLFNGEETQPLSITSNNVDNGNMIDNADGSVPIEYDGISSKMTIYAPVVQGLNTIKIGIADTGDSIYDSGLFIGGLKGVREIGSGGVYVKTDSTDNDDHHMGNEAPEEYTCGDGNDTVFAAGGNDLIYGGQGADNLNGGNGDDNIFGGTGKDHLHGGEGDDVLAGGSGQDTAHYTKNVGHTLNLNVTTGQNTGEGVDLLVSIENLTAGGGNDILIGNSAANTLIGGGGKDKLKGGGGNDTLIGGKGSDVYIYGSGDTIKENYGEGNDTVVTMSNYTLGNNLEKVVIKGTGNVKVSGNASKNKLIGNSGANKLFGGGGDDTLKGGAGNDKLQGGKGHDILIGGTGKDSFKYANSKEGGDTIKGFSKSQDKMQFVSSNFGNLCKGKLKNKNFVANKTGSAMDGNDYFVFNTSTKTLYYDKNGNHAGGAVKIAKFNTYVGLSNIQIVA